MQTTSCGAVEPEHSGSMQPSEAETMEPNNGRELGPRAKVGISSCSLCRVRVCECVCACTRACCTCLGWVWFGCGVLVPQEESAGHLVCPPVPEGEEPVLELLVVASGGLVHQQLQVVKEQLVVQEQAQGRGVVLTQDILDRDIKVHVLVLHVFQGEGVQFESPSPSSSFDPSDSAPEGGEVIVWPRSAL